MEKYYELVNLTKEDLDFLANDKDFNWLHIAAKNNMYTLLEQLLEHGVNPNTLNLAGQTALQEVCEMDCENEQISCGIVHLLMKFGANPNLAENKNFPLLRAAEKGNFTVVYRLLSGGAGSAKISVTDKEGMTALHHAVKRRHMKVVEILLEHYINVDAINNEEDSALHLAARNKDKDMMKILLRHLPKQYANRRGYTPLDIFLAD
jgi:ankyrin repeat protein